MLLTHPRPLLWLADGNLEPSAISHQRAKSRSWNGLSCYMKYNIILDPIPPSIEVVPSCGLNPWWLGDRSIYGISIGPWLYKEIGCQWIFRGSKIQCSHDDGCLRTKLFTGCGTLGCTSNSSLHLGFNLAWFWPFFSWLVTCRYYLGVARECSTDEFLQEGNNLWW